MENINNTPVRNSIEELYAPLKNTHHTKKEIPFIYCNLESAELIKYASNAFLATKIAFINEIANLSETVGADITAVSTAIGTDPRIGMDFFLPGPGYGGSCFPKDTRALVRTAHEYGTSLRIVDSTIEANEYQKEYMVKKLILLLNKAYSDKQALEEKLLPY